MAAWADVSGKAARSTFATSGGNSGGVPDGYNLAVQSYCPPNVTQRSFFSKKL